MKKNITIIDKEMYLRLSLLAKAYPCKFNCRLTISQEEVLRNKDMRKVLEIKMYEGVDDILDLLFSNNVSFSPNETCVVYGKK